MPEWLDAMLEPFQDPEVIGVKGVYRTRQTSVVGRFVQIEYEDRYRLMAGVNPSIDFIDTYSAAFRRDRFLAMNGYDTSFPVACAEDIELSYRMSARGWKMKFAPSGDRIPHASRYTLARYLKKKYKFAFWRVLAVRKNPLKAVKDSHTPQLMKLQLLFAPALLLACGLRSGSCGRRGLRQLLVLAAFLMSTLPFTLRAFRKDRNRRIAFSGTASRTSLGAAAGSRRRTVLCPPQDCPDPDQVGSLNWLKLALVRWQTAVLSAESLRIASRRGSLRSFASFVNTISLGKGRIGRGDLKSIVGRICGDERTRWTRERTCHRLRLGCTLRENVATIFPKRLEYRSFVWATTNASG